MIFTVASLKGGVGKTTTAVHLAAYLQEFLGPTLLIDADPGQSALWWGATGGLPFKTVPGDEAGGFVNEVEHIVIDTMPEPNLEELADLASKSHLLIIPTQAEGLGLRMAIRTARELGQGGSVNHALLLTMVPAYAKRDEQEARLVAEAAEVSVLKASIPRLIAVARAANARVPVYELSEEPMARSAWQRYIALGQEVVGWQQP